MNKIPLPASYHNFADKRTFMGIPNAMDVISNIAIVIPAVYLLQKQKKFSLLSIHILLIALASTYYHLQPTDDRIFWDMLFIATTHVVLLSYFIKDEYAIILYIGSILSVVYWKQYNDLRPYILLLTDIPLYIISLIYKNKKVNNYLYPIVIFGIMARALEYNDHYVYKMTNNMISGHTAKHITGIIMIWFTVIVLVKLNKLK